MTSYMSSKAVKSPHSREHHLPSTLTSVGRTCRPCTPTQCRRVRVRQGEVAREWHIRHLSRRTSWLMADKELIVPDMTLVQALLMEPQTPVISTAALYCKLLNLQDGA